MVRNTHLAEDVAQGVFVEVAQSARQLADCRVLPGWLHRTTQNLAANASMSIVNCAVPGAANWSARPNPRRPAASIQPRESNTVRPARPSGRSKESRAVAEESSRQQVAPS